MKSTRIDADAQRRFDERRRGMLREVDRLEAHAAGVEDPVERERLQQRAELYRCGLQEDSP
jgi:hypothetical protein